MLVDTPIAPSYQKCKVMCAQSQIMSIPQLWDISTKKAAKAFPENLSQLVKDKLFTNTSCEQEFVDVYCQMMRGSICSTDMTLRMNAVSQQDCTLTITKCIIKVAKVQNYFMEVCKLFPNANTAQRVPLPSVVSNDVVNTKWKSFVYAVFS